MVDTAAQPAFGYRPLDLGPHCTLRGPIAGAPAPTGNVTFHGIPFRVGDPADHSAPEFVVLLPHHDAVEVPVGAHTLHLVVAHRLLDESVVDPVEATGAAAGRYEFQYVDGGIDAVDIRRRFEIDRTPESSWDFDVPFGATMSSTPVLPDRYAGRWDELGARLSEGALALPPAYLLWVWTNPRPTVGLRSVRMSATTASILVAAVTISDLPERPLRRVPAVPVTVRAASPDATGEPVVQVDRGTASYPVALAPWTADAPLRGFGQDSDPAAGFSTQVAAVPSATLTIADDGGAPGSVQWQDVRAEGAADAGRFRVTLRDTGRTWCRVRVLDDADGMPVPCRINFRTPEGISYPPSGHPASVTRGLDQPGDVRLDALTYAYIDGRCEGWLPRGDVVVEASRGFEYEPLSRTVTVDEGTTTLELRLRRAVSMNAQGWYSGDTHAHFLSASGAVFEQQGEDLNVVNLLATQWGGLHTGFEDFSGRAQRAAKGPYLTYVAQENRQHLLGHLVLMGLREPVLPACSDGLPEAEIGGALEATLSDWADRCHEQGGTVVVPHVPRPNGELAALVVTGRADAFEMIIQHPDAHAEYYRYLNCGYRMPLVGGTDKMGAEVPLGLYRTYAHLGDEEFGYESWCRAVRAGRTFLSGGPLVDFRLDGQLPGSEVHLGSAGHVDVEVEVRSVVPFDTVQVIRNGEVVAEANPGPGTRQLTLAENLPVRGDSWFAVRCGGPGYFDSNRHHDVWRRGAFAHTSPVYVTVGERWHMFDERIARYLMKMLDGGLSYVREVAPTFPAGSTTHHHGEASHDRYLARPFEQAVRELARRLEEMR